MCLYPSSYPAGHVYVHKFLYNLTQSGTNLKAAQQIYSLLYIAALAATCGIYYKAGNIPNWALMVLPLSKRLHSIYVLRLFNDCWEVVGTQATVLAFASGYDSLGIMLFRYVVDIPPSGALLMHLQCLYIHQDVCPAIPSRYPCSSRQTERPPSHRRGCWAVGILSSRYRVAIHSTVSSFIPQQCFRILSAIPVQVDCKLAVRARRNVP